MLERHKDNPYIKVINDNDQLTVRVTLITREHIYGLEQRINHDPEVLDELTKTFGEGKIHTGAECYIEFRPSDTDTTPNLFKI